MEIKQNHWKTVSTALPPDRRCEGARLIKTAAPARQPKLALSVFRENQPFHTAVLLRRAPLPLPCASLYMGTGANHPD